MSLTQQTATAQLALLRSGEVSAETLTRPEIARLREAGEFEKIAEVDQRLVNERRSILAQLEENLRAWDTTLSPELLQQIDAIRWELRDPAL